MTFYLYIIHIVHFRLHITITKHFIIPIIFFLLFHFYCIYIVLIQFEFLWEIQFRETTHKYGFKYQILNPIKYRSSFNQTNRVHI